MKPISVLSVENFLSLRRLDLELEDLNVLVGANGAGKTNVLKVFEFLGEVARRELAPAINRVGGFDSLLFRGAQRQGQSARIALKGRVTKNSSGGAPDEYRLTFWRTGTVGRPRSGNTEIYQRDEALVFKRFEGPGRRITLKGRRVTVGFQGSKSGGSEQQTLQIQGEATGLGTLRRLSDDYGASEWNAFAELVEQLRLFEIDVEKIRRPSKEVMSSTLNSDASNVAAFLLWLRDHDEEAFNDISEDVRFVLPSFREFRFTEIGGSDEAVRLDIVEGMLTGATPLGRASYGTIRAIALFCMLHDPKPPKLTCLEEVDHGLHPHALDRIVERLRQASKRTQIILATHSPALVNRLKTSELVVVERDAETGGSRVIRPDEGMVRRLQRETGYRLGELWFSGVLGGAPS